MTQAVITGVGSACGLGLGIDALFDGLSAGRCAIAPIRNFDAATFPAQVAGEVPVATIKPEWLSHRIGAESLALGWHSAGILRERKVVFALLAAEEAWRSAGCGEDEKMAWLCIALGLEQAFCEDFGEIFDGAEVDWAADGTANLPSMRYRSSVDLGARCVTELLDLHGPTTVHSSACAAGVMSMAHAASLIERGITDIALCGASDSMVNPLGLGGMAMLGTTSPRNEASACRPFDRHRDGLAIGEGAAMFVLESEDRARSRGARAIARVMGYATTQDAHKLSAPRPDGVCASRAMAGAIAKAKLEPRSIGYVNAHGTGTVLNDAAEARAIRSVFKGHADDVPVSSIKGAVGHLMAASGAIEIAASLLAFERGVLPPTTNLLDQDPDCDINVIGGNPREANPEFLLSNSFGFGGQNASIVLGRTK